ncbi:MAG: hypothetical protein ABIJ47_01570 [Candidatus Bathyarchaeota archaeon]
MSLEAFLAEWCWPGPYRSVGTPYQTYYTHHEAVDRLAALINQGAAPVYMSTNPYSEDGEIALLDRLFFDFDSKEKIRYALDDTQAFSEALARYYGVGALTTFSGKKGYHVHVFLQEPVYGPPDHLAALYKAIRDLLVKGSTYRTLDPQAADATRLHRVPYSVHQGTGALCVPVDRDLQPFTLHPGFSAVLREHGIGPELVRVAERQLHRPPATPREYRGPKGRLRPCMEAVFEASVHEGPHLMRVAAVAELHAEGARIDEILSRFAGMQGFDEGKTRYYIEHALRRGYRPFKCATIQKLGGCLGSACRIYRGPPTPSQTQEVAVR